MREKGRRDREDPAVPLAPRPRVVAGSTEELVGVTRRAVMNRDAVTIPW